MKIRKPKKIDLNSLIKAGLFHKSPVTGDLLKDGKGHLRPDYSEWADFIIKQFHIVTDESIILTYDKSTGNYSPGKDRIKIWMERHHKSFSTRDFSEILEHVKNRTYLSEEEKKIKQQKILNLILLINGPFDLKNRKLLRKSPDLFFTCAPLPFEYDKKADCEITKKFLSEIVHERDVIILQEMIGYCFLRSLPFHKAFMFIGEGRNGKSTLINLLVALFGTENVSKLGLHQIANGGFLLAHLKDKMLNVYPDLPSKALGDTGYFKVLTGGDWLTVDRKFKEPTSFINYAKMIFSCNKLPEAKDDSTAFFRRWILVNFPNDFPPEKADSKLLKKLTTDEELSGIFNWALEGLDRLNTNQDFTYSLTTTEVQDQYERLSNSLLAFVKDWVESDSQGLITKDDFFRKYAEYCRELNIPVKTKSIVGRDLASHISVTIGSHRKSRAWVGIKFMNKKNGESTAVATSSGELLDMIDKIKEEET